jgi:hypothetical protein
VLLDISLQPVAIKQIQGTTLQSPLAQQVVRTNGVVTYVVRRGFFLQTPKVKWDGKASDAIFVYSPDCEATRGAVLEVEGQVIDYLAHDTAKQVTQIHMEKVQPLKTRDGDGHRYRVEPIELTQDPLPQSAQELAILLNSLAAMMVSIRPGQTFIAPSNPFGDYVLALDGEEPDASTLRSEPVAMVSRVSHHQLQPRAKGQCWREVAHSSGWADELPGRLLSNRHQRTAKS